MEKYYDLIVSLIKANRKYPGCEALLDEIVKDVYAHAEVVLNTVTNESVISSYLSKIVTTSMITVPRRLGIQVQRPRAAETVQVQPAVVEQTPVEEDELANVQEDEIQEEIIEEPEALVEATLDEADENAELIEDFEELDLDETVVEDDSEAEDEEEPLEEDEIPAEEEVLQEADDENELDESDEVLEEVEEIVQPVDKTLVDKMINGVSNEPASEIEELIENDDDELLSEGDNEALTELDTAEGNLLEEDSMQDASELDEALEIQEYNADEEVELFESSETEELLSDDVVESEENDVQSTGAKSYKIFEFAPQKLEYDVDGILPEIQDMQAKNPELNIIEIFKLKYQDKLSVDEIVSKLNIPEDKVLDILNEFMYIVKD